jgi:hypothetical protein
MKKTRNTITTAFLILFSLNNIMAQENPVSDIIVKVNDEKIECTVTEMSTTEVKYHYVDRPGVTLAIENELVDHIILSTGETVKPKNNDNEILDIAFNKQKKTAIKLGLFTPLQGYTDIGIEYSHKPMHSIEGTLGIIGLGSDEFSFSDRESINRGVTITAGYKVYSKPDFHLRKVRNSHRMSGLYIKPTLAATYVNTTDTWVGSHYDNNTYEYIEHDFETKSSVLQAAFLLKLGKQYIFGDIFSLDLNGGLGFGMKDVTLDDNRPNTFTEAYFPELNSYGNFGFTTFQNGALAMSLDFKIGVLIK